jgi:hypothetical protein
MVSRATSGNVARTHHERGWCAMRFRPRTFSALSLGFCGGGLITNVILGQYVYAAIYAVATLASFGLMFERGRHVG